MTREDRFTNTPEDAAAFERRFGPEFDDGPDLSDVYGDSPAHLPSIITDWDEPYWASLLTWEPAE